MDAKAKVVRWECRPLNWEVQYQQRDDGEWVKFPDHEAALADVQVLLDVDKDIIESQAKDLHRLLTGLEALAGELSENIEYADHMQGAWVAGANHGRQDAAKRIRTLASCAAGEKSTEKEMKLNERV